MEKRKEKLIKALESLYEILDEIDHDDVEGLAMLQIYLDEAKFKGTPIFSPSDAGEIVKSIAWRLSLARAIMNVFPVERGDVIAEGDRMVNIGEVQLVVNIEM